MSTLNTSVWKVNNFNIIHKWLKENKCQHYTQVVKRIKKCQNYTQVVKRIKKCQYYTQVVKRLKMSILYTSG